MGGGVSINSSVLKTTGDLRKMLANLATGIVAGDIKVQEAAVAIKACKEINSSLYSEIKATQMLNELGKQTAALGNMPIGRE